MKKWKKGLGALTACMLVMGMTPGVSQAAEYSSGTFSGLIQSGGTLPALFPGDVIWNTELYMGDNPAPISLEVSDGITPEVWTNQSGTVYTVRANEIPVDAIVEEAPEDMQPMEGGEPVPPAEPVYTEPKFSYVLEPWGGTLETVGASLSPDGASMAYQVPSAGNYVDDAGALDPLAPEQITAGAYAAGSQVSLSAAADKDGMPFAGWSVYTVSDYMLHPVAVETIAADPSLIPGLAPEMLAASTVTLTASSFRSRLLFVPVYAEAPAAEPDVPEAEPDVPEAPSEEPNAEQAMDPTLDPNANQTADLNQDANQDPALDPNANQTADLNQDANQDPALDPNANQTPDPFQTNTNDDAIKILNEDSYTTDNGSGDVDETTPHDPEPAATQAIRVQNASFVNELTTTDAEGNIIAVVQQGATVTIKAIDAPEGKRFTGWSVTPEGVASATEPSDQTLIYVTVDRPGIVVAAVYEDVIPEQTITVRNATIENAETTDNGDGTATATVAQGETVTITAAPAPEGEQFKEWKLTAEGTEVEASSTTEPTIQVTVGAAEVGAEPVYTAAAVEPAVSLAVIPDGAGEITQKSDPVYDGNHITYSYTLTPASGYQVDSFTAIQGSNTLKTAEGDKKTLEFTAEKAESPAGITVTASLSLIPHTLTVSSGSADKSSMARGDTATVTANAAQPGWRFTKWTVAGSGTVASETASQTTFTMGDADAAVTANYEQIPYVLTVNSGSGSGTHYNGDQVVITANTPEKGYRFRSWTLTSGNGTIASATAAQTTFTMTTSDAAVTANYELIPYTLTVKNGSGSGSFTMGTTTDVTPNFPPSGKEFDKWEVTSGSIHFDSKKEYYAAVTMKASDATVTALYKDGPNPNNNTITGLQDGAEYLKSTTLTFTAGGAGMDNNNPNPGDYRYRPASYQIGSVGGSWTASPYTTSMAINAAGDYTLTVTYAKDVYDGKSWNPDGTSVTKSITFHIVNALSVKTGDNSPLIPLAIAGGAALAVIIALVVVLSKRRKR